jgi:hypothetical protein
LVTGAGNPRTVDQNVYRLLDLPRCFLDRGFIRDIQPENLQHARLGKISKIGSRVGMATGGEHLPTIGLILPRKLQSQSSTGACDQD